MLRGPPAAPGGCRRLTRQHLQRCVDRRVGEVPQRPKVLHQVDEVILQLQKGDDKSLVMAPRAPATPVAHSSPPPKVLHQVDEAVLQLQKGGTAPVL